MDRPAKILVVDDSEQNLALVRAYLAHFGYDVLTASSGEACLEVVAGEVPDLILLDVLMPGMDGYEVCRILKEGKATWQIPVILLTSLSEVEDKVRGIEAGADDFISKPFNKLELSTRVRGLLKTKRLYEDLESAQSIIFALALALEARDPYTEGHSERVAEYTVAIGKEMGLTDQHLTDLRNAGILHDIGKIGISESILRKEGPFTPEEYDIMKTHPAKGARICLPLKMADRLVPIIKHHQEKYDGSGYPDGLKGEEIPQGARIMAVADAYDAMTSDRPYRKSLGEEEAVRRLKEGKGIQFDPEAVDAFVRLYEKGEMQSIRESWGRGGLLYRMIEEKGA